MARGILRAAQRSQWGIGLVIVAILAVSAVMVVRGTDSSTRTATAYFAGTVGIYEGDNVTILGINVGKIVEIEPMKDSVRVTFTYNRPVPADAKAILTAPSLVPVRTLALSPAYAGGPQLADGATIPISRTAVPVEWDEVKTQLTRLSAALGPSGANADGALGDFVGMTAENLRGNGAPLRTAVRDLAEAMRTLDENGGAIFGTVRNLDVFVDALNSSSGALVRFNELLLAASETLDAGTEDLEPALVAARRAIADLKPLLQANNGKLLRAINDVAPALDLLATKRDDLAQILHLAPTGLSDIYGMYDPSSESLMAYLVGGGPTSAGLICALFTDAASGTCTDVLRPFLALAAASQMPGGASILVREPGSTSTRKAPTPSEELEGLMMPEDYR